MQSSSIIFFVILSVMLLYNIVKPWASKDRSLIWSPITPITLTMIYYIVIPSCQDGFLYYNSRNVENQPLFYISSVLFYVCVLFQFNARIKGNYARWNSYFTVHNAQKLALVLFVIALLCYVPFRGFRYTIASEDAYNLTARTGFVSYFIDLISILVGSSCLAYVGLYNKHAWGIKRRLVLFIILYFALVLYIVGGFRYRIVMLILAFSTVYHLFPSPKKLNYKVLLPVAIVAYLGFAIMDVARTYGAGIDIDRAGTISLDDASRGARENVDVMDFSIATIDYCAREDAYVLFEPIYNAIAMPIPRAFFPWKPDGQYMQDIQRKIIGNSDEGAAVMVIAEAFMMFSWLGVIMYGLFIGWLAKKIWYNYRMNSNSIGAILLLALFNGFCYTWLSRGYMGGVFNDFVYFVVMPFLLTFFIKKVIKV